MYTPKDYKGKIPLNAIPVKDSTNKAYYYIKRNAIRCKLCGEVIESKYQHDFKTCKCGKAFIDGGLCYQRIGGELKDIENLSEQGTATEEDYKVFRKAHDALKEYKHKQELLRVKQIMEELEKDEIKFN